MLISGVIDVGLGKSAEASSLSAWSVDGADGVLKRVGNAPFGFHTECEDTPWWKVDLGVVVPLTAIVIHNRRDIAQERASTLRVQISDDGHAWKVVHSGQCHFGAAPEGEPLRLPLGRRFTARYVRLSLDETQILHLSRVELLAETSDVTLAEFAKEYGFEVRPPVAHGDPGYELHSADGSARGPLMGLSINENGAFGNCLMQYTLAIHLALHLGLRYIKISSNDRSELISWRESFCIEDITFIPGDAKLPVGGTFLHGSFFDLTPFRNMSLPSATQRHEIARRYVRKIFNVLPSDMPEKPADCLMIHIRSGDIFDKWINPHYVQPPLAFYRKVIDLLIDCKRITSARLVFENRLNPVIEPLENYLEGIGLPFTVCSGAVSSDIQALMNAKYYIFGVGTFGPGVCRMSGDIEAVFYFAPGISPGFKSIPSIKNCIELVDGNDGYMKSGDWQNTDEQRQMMVEYPDECVVFDNESDLVAAGLLPNRA